MKPGYIQIAINRIKGVDMEYIKDLKTKGHKNIRIRLEKETDAKKKQATAVVPLGWIIESRYEYDHNKNDKAFQSFISDWISGWV